MVDETTKDLEYMGVDGKDVESDSFYLNDMVSGIYGGIQGAGYRGSVLVERDKLIEGLTSFAGKASDVSTLKGDIAEFWHGGTFNINAAQRGSTHRVFIDRSNKFASADLTSNFGSEYGLKYYKTGSESAKQQAKSIYERLKGLAEGDEQKLQNLLAERGLTEQMLNDPMYAGQVRIVPKDQLEEARKWLERKISEESTKRPDQVARYKETLKFLDDRIRDGSGNESIALSRSDAERIARMAKDGDVDIKALSLTDKDVIKLNYVVGNAAKVGLEAAAVSAVISMVMSCIQKYRTEGKSLADFELDDWKDVCGDTVFHAGTAGVSAATLSIIGSVCSESVAAFAVPGASSLLMALFGIAALVPDYVDGNMTQEEFVVECEMVCLQAAFILLGTVLGTAAIPMGAPIGALVGVIAASIAWFLIEKYFGEELRDLCSAFNEEIERLFNAVKEFFEQLIMAIKAKLEHIEFMLHKDFDIKLESMYKKSVVYVNGSYVLDEELKRERRTTYEQN